MQAYANQSKIRTLASQYRLCLAERHRYSSLGDQPGKRVGSSLEFQDRRDYQAGDDLRLIDWRAYARTDRLSLKLYREEINPRVQLFIDRSLSMSVTPEKAERRMDLALFTYFLAQNLHASTEVYAMGGRPSRLNTPLEMLLLPDEAEESPLAVLRSFSPVRRDGAIKIFISDFLFPFAPADLVSSFGHSDRIVFVQVLSAFEDEPQEKGLSRLIDVEAGEHLDLALNPAAVREYKSRLSELKGSLDRLCRMNGGCFASISEAHSLEEAVKNLYRAGVVEGAS